MQTRPARPPLPPRWFIRLAWRIHRGMVRVLGPTTGVRRPRGNRYGLLRLTTTGRRTGQDRTVILAYLDDGPNQVLLAMNGWGPGEPAWWLNLRANPEATAVLPGGPRRVRAHLATGAERDRLWSLWRGVDTKLDGYAARRPTETAVVVLTPRA